MNRVELATNFFRYSDLDVVKLLVEGGPKKKSGKRNDCLLQRVTWNAWRSTIWQKWQKVAESGRKWQKCGRSGRRTESRTRGGRKCGGQIRKRIAVREPSPFLKDVLPKTRHTPSRRMVRCRGEEVVKYKRIRDNALMTLFRDPEHVLKGLLPRVMQGVACWQTSYRWATLFIAGTLSRWPHVLLDPSLRKKKGR